MKNELIQYIKESNKMLHKAKKQLNEIRSKVINIPDEWFYDDLDESLSEMEIIKYLYSKWLFYEEEKTKIEGISSTLVHDIFEGLFSHPFNEPHWIIEGIYELEDKTGIFSKHVFEDIKEGAYTLEEFFGKVILEERNKKMGHLFNLDEYENLYFKGIKLEYTDSMFIRGYVLPMDILKEIDIRTLPKQEFPFLLPTATSIISSKLKCPSIVIEEVNEDGALLNIYIYGDDWDNPLKLNHVLKELKSLFDKEEKLKEIDELTLISSNYVLQYRLTIPIFNSKELYNYVNELLIDLEAKAYEKVLKLAMDNLENNKSK